MSASFMKYILSIPERMERVRILVLPEDFDNAMRILHGLNAIHVVELREEVIEEELRKRILRVEKLQRIITDLIGFLEKPITITLKEEIDATTLDELLDQYLSKLQTLHNDIIALKNRINHLDKLVEEYQGLKKYIEILALVKPELKLSNLRYEGKTLISYPIISPKDKWQELVKLLEKHGALVNTLSMLQDETLLQVIYVKNKEQSIKNLLEQYRCIILNIPSIDVTIAEFKEHIDKKITELISQRDSILSEIRDKISKEVNDIALAKILADNELEKVKAFKAFIKTRYVNGVEGWIPVSIKGKLLNILNNTIKRYIITFNKPKEGEEPPTKTNNPKGIRNFEVLTKTYGVPRYNEWDPTPLIAYSFPVFFGLMLGDVVYGIMLLLVTKYILDKFVEDPESETIKKLKNILYISGVTSAIAGFLSGTFLGQTVNVNGGFGSILSPILGPYMSLLLVSSPILDYICNMLSNPLNFILLAMMIGLVHVNIALIISFIKAVKHRSMGDILQNLGLMLIQVFGIPCILIFMFKYEIPILHGLENILLIGVLVSIGLIVTSQFIIYRALGVLTWIFTITGLLGDVLSYTRIAGVGMATVYLANGYTFLSLMVYNGLSSAIGIPIVNIIVASVFFLVVYVFTQLMNFTLGILGSFIHSLRLCFVEFLTKFYEGGGVEFNPVKIIIRRRVTLKPGL